MRVDEVYLKSVELRDGIFTPGYSGAVLDKFLSPHYASEAGVESQTFDLEGNYSGLIKRVLFELTAIGRITSPMQGLELGAGFGSATFPALGLLDKLTLIATELSIPMLKKLQEKAVSRNLADRLQLLQLNAEELDFRESSFDLVFGAAVLHHLFDPARVIQDISRCLKPHGVAFFFEPFENGYDILGLAWREILSRKSQFLRAKLSTAQRAYFADCVFVWNEMKNEDKQSGFFAGKDDKWLFSKSFFQDAGNRFGFKRVIIEPIVMFDSLMYSHMSENGYPIEQMPQWVRDILIFYAAHFTARVKADLLTEGMIVLLKD
jgi:ubiquinone/menaquinone biosynthesis C-methylase UbiE